MNRTDFRMESNLKLNSLKITPPWICDNSGNQQPWEVKSIQLSETASNNIEKINDSTIITNIRNSVGSEEINHLEWSVSEKYIHIDDGKRLIFIHSFYFLGNLLRHAIFLSTPGTSKFELIKFTHGMRFYNTTGFHIQKGFFAFFISEMQKMYITTNIDMNFTHFHWPENSNQFWINPQNHDEIAFLTKEKKIRKIFMRTTEGKDPEEIVSIYDSDECYHGWVPGEERLFLTCDREDLYDDYGLNIIHYQNENKTIIKSNCIYLRKYEGFYVIKCLENHSVNIYFSDDGKQFKICRFPKRLVIWGVGLAYKIESLVFMAVKAENSKFSLYSAFYSQNETELKFRRILSNVVISTCPTRSLNFHPSIRGMLMISTKYYSYSQYHRQNMISFNYGSTWVHSKLISYTLNGTKHSCQTKCRYSFVHCNPRRPDIQPVRTPWLILKYGYLGYDDDNPKRWGLFISRDAGLSWIVNDFEHTVYAALDQGNIIMTAHENGKIAKLSFDECRTWISIEIDTKKEKVMSIQELKVNGITEALIFARNNTKIIIYHISFKDALGKICHTNDLEDWGITLNGRKCHFGVEYTVTRRKMGSFCMIDDTNKENKLTESKKCSCYAEDSGCPIGYYFENGACVADPLNYDSDSTNNCEVGKLFDHDAYSFTTSGIECLDPTFEYKAERKKRICTKYDKEFVVLIHTKNEIKLFGITGMINTQTPESLMKIEDQVKSCVVDFHTNILYAVIDTKVKFYNFSEKDFSSIVWTDLENLINVKMIQLDTISGNIYYQTTSDQIKVMSLGTKKSKTIWMNKDVSDFKVFPHSGNIAIRLKDLSLHITDLNGSDEFLISTGRVADYTTYLDDRRIIYVLDKDKNIYISDVANMSEITNDPEILLELPDVPEKIEALSNKLVVYMNKRIHVYSYKTYMSYNLDVDFPVVTKIELMKEVNPGYRQCPNSGCDQLCFDQKSGSICECEDGMYFKDGNCQKS